MSNKVNDDLYERAYELIEEFTNHPSGVDRTLERALQRNDVDEVYKLVAHLEGQLSQEHFYESGILNTELPY